jgi:hypothetical protein
MHDKTLVLNTDLEGLVFPVLDQISDNDFARVSTITVPFQTHESVPIDGLALINWIKRNLVVVVSDIDILLFSYYPYGPDDPAVHLYT